MKKKKYKIFIEKYDILSNDYIWEGKIIITDDIYHEI